MFGVDAVDATTREQAIAIIEQGITGVILGVRLERDDYGGLALAAYLREQHADVPAILLMGHADPFVQLECKRLRLRYLIKPLLSIASVVDYLRKHPARPKRKHSGVREKTSDGGSPRIRSACEGWQEMYSLSEMETAVLFEAAQGGTRATIALVLDLAPETVKWHTRNLLAKTLDDTLAGAGARLLREIVEPPGLVRPKPRR